MISLEGIALGKLLYLTFQDFRGVPDGNEFSSQPHLLSESGCPAIVAGTNAFILPKHFFDKSDSQDEPYCSGGVMAGSWRGEAPDQDTRSPQQLFYPTLVLQVKDELLCIIEKRACFRSWTP